MPGIIPATIVSIRDETPTVRVFGLDLDGQRLVFLPGQWIDCYLTPAGGPEVAGYSMTSTPGESTRIEIAVKRVGDNAVTHHLHAGAREGDVLYIDGGYGDFAYTREMGSSIVLIAGGIGITPLMSMVRYVDESAPGTRAMLLYSASSPEELAFKGVLDGIAARNTKVRVLYTVTRAPGGPWDGYVGRIDEARLGSLGLDPEAVYYVCGPPDMVREVTPALRRLGMPDGQVHYELWS